MGAKYEVRDIQLGNGEEVLILLSRQSGFPVHSPLRRIARIRRLEVAANTIRNTLSCVPDFWEWGVKRDADFDDLLNDGMQLGPSTCIR